MTNPRAATDAIRELKNKTGVFEASSPAEGAPDGEEKTKNACKRKTEAATDEADDRVDGAEGSPRKRGRARGHAVKKEVKQEGRDFTNAQEGYVVEEGVDEADEEGAAVSRYQNI